MEKFRTIESFIITRIFHPTLPNLISLDQQKYEERLLSLPSPPLLPFPPPGTLLGNLATTKTCNDLL